MQDLEEFLHSLIRLVPAEHAAGDSFRGDLVRAHLEWWSESHWYRVDPKDERHLSRIERRDGDSVRNSTGVVMLM